MSGGWGVDRGWMPLPTRPQQYRDPSSLAGPSVCLLDRDNRVEEWKNERFFKSWGGCYKESGN